MIEFLKNSMNTCSSLGNKVIRYLKWRVGLFLDHGQEFILRTYYSFAMKYSLIITDGQQEIPVNRVAIYVIFPSTGLLQSHISTIKALVDARYSVLVVSNLKLDVDSRKRLCDLCWKLIERPNFGYDFGAFRDGVNYVAPYFPSLTYLVFMNDSAWYPLPNSVNWLEQAENKEEDFVGAVANFSVATPHLSSWREFTWKYDPTVENFHYCSFALLFKNKAFSSQAFIHFWKTLRITNNKIRTVERGEIGLSQALIKSGLSHSCTMDVERLDIQLNDMEYPELLSFVRNLVIPEEPGLLNFKLALLSESASLPEPERSQALRQAGLAIIARTGIAYAIPRYSYESLGFSFLKKSPLKSNGDAKTLILELTSELEGSAGALIHSEASALADRTLN